MYIQIVKCLSLLILDLVECGCLRLQLIVFPLGLFELGFQLVELIEAHILILELLAALLCMLDFLTQSFKFGVLGLDFFFFVCILSLLEVEEAKVLFFTC